MSLAFIRLATALAALLVGAFPTDARQSAGISGFVSDQTGAAVVGARVSVSSGARPPQAAVTDSQGRYRIQALQAGEYVVRVTASGFQRAERRVAVSASDTAVADFRLDVQTLVENVVVTAEQTKAEVEAQRALTPGAVTIIEGDELYQRHVSNLADMLRYVPGVWADSGYGNDELFFSSRYLPVTTADGNNHNRVIDPLTARYASVARGANALTYGASALGGAIRLHLSDHTQQPAPVGVPRGRQLRLA
ncbi:MAG: carboxypeptidase regulatory-like domain-containing protein [Vicinamibacterales bacterium]